MVVGNRELIRSIVVPGTIVIMIGTAVWVWASNSNTEKETIVLGAVLSFEGTYETGGIHTFHGYEFARERINSRGGIKVGGKSYQIEIRYEDDESKSKNATDMSERLTKDDGIKFMLGPYSSAMTKAVAAVAWRYKRPLVAAEGASPSLYNRGNPYIFGLLSTADQYLASFISLVVDRERKAGRDPRQLRLAVVVQNDRFSLYVREPVIKDAGRCGLPVVINDKVPKVITSMSRAMDKIEEVRPDILVISGHARGANEAARQLAEREIHIPYLAFTHCEAAKIHEEFPDAVEGAYCPAQWASTLPYKDDLFGTAKEFSESIKDTYPGTYDEVPYQVASAAAALLVWKDAFERANSFDTEKLRDALAATDLQTFYGTIRFSSKGAISSKPMVLRQIVSGKYKRVEAPTAPSDC